MKYPHLFKSGTIGTLRLKNRLVMPPMVRNYATKDGLVNDRYLAHIERIAAGGVGMMILEASFISQDGRGFGHQLGVQSDKTIPGLRKLARAAHKYKAAIGVQIYHAGRQTTKATTGMQCVGPSPIPCPLEQEMPHVLTKEEIAIIVQNYAAAAKRCKKAGMDFVEIHGAHGYLITQFLSPFSNKRRDEYGGNFKNRMRFALEVIAAVRKVVGPKYPVTIRVSGEENVEGGLTLKDMKKIAKELEKAGVDAIHVSAGNYGSYALGHMIPPMAVEDGVLVKLAAGIKKSVKIPVITVAKIRDPKMGNEIVKKGKADFVAIGRTLLADPDWPNKVKANKFDLINPCVACNQGCITRLFSGLDVQCTVNPETSRELMFRKKPAKKKIVIIGGGPAGLSAARTAARFGHKVILLEKERRLGGQLHLAAAAPHREGWDLLLKTLLRDMKKLKVDVRTGQKVDAAMVKKFKPDLVVVALGSSANEPPIVGIEHCNVYNSREVLSGAAKVMGRVVLIGGGCAGAQTAEYLAVAGHPTTIVEYSPNIALDAPMDERFLLLGRLKELGVKMMTQTKALTISGCGVTIAKGNEKKELPADTIVVCLGSRSNDGLARELRKVVRHVKVVGDAVKPRRIGDAMAEGALAVL